MRQIRLTNEDIGALCSALAQLYHAGIGLGDALALLAEDETTAVYKELLVSMSRRADDGASLAQIFRSAGCFPSYMCGLIEVGEQVGKPEETLHALARYYDSQARIEQRTKAGLFYPSVLLMILLAVAVILLVWVLPVFNDVYAQLGSRLSGAAGGLLILGTILRKAMPVICALLGLAVILIIITATVPTIQDTFTRKWRGIRGDKGVTRKINTAHFVQALSMGMSSGLSAHEAVNLASTLTTGTGAFQERCSACLSKVNGGDTLVSALRETELLSKAECRLLDAGTRCGNGAQVMEQIAARLLEESETALETQTSKIEPSVVIIMSVVVGVILLSVMLPLMHVMTTIG